jgi:sulfite dehydrogenase (cytochrome) subunit B
MLLLAEPMVLPPETTTLRPGAGAELATANCLMCHSAEYMSSQPVFPRASWQASVNKMIGKFGAPIPKEQVEPLVDYLVKSYGNEQPSVKTEPMPPAEKKERER